MAFLHWREINSNHFTSPGTVHLGIASLDEEDQVQFNHLLSDQERTRAARLKNKDAANRQVIARGILRLVLGRVLQMKPTALQFSANPYGKPDLSLPSNSGISFNIAHSANLIIFAITKGNQVGVDVEIIDRKRDFSTLSSLVFSPEEQAKLTYSCDPINAFYTLWTAKEAILKAAGRGFSFPPNRLNINTNNGHASQLHLPEGLSGGKTCFLSTHSDLKGYSAAIAILM